MTEAFPGSPYEGLEPEVVTDWTTVPEAIYTPEGPGPVTNPVAAELYDFGDAQTFLVGLSDYDSFNEREAAGMIRVDNFLLHFRDVPQGSFTYASMRQQTPAFRRFEIIYPDLHAYLASHLGSGATPTAELAEPLFRAYEVMRHLVDADDEYVADRQGTVVPGYLVN